MVERWLESRSMGAQCPGFCVGVLSLCRPLSPGVWRGNNRTRACTARLYQSALRSVSAPLCAGVPKYSRPDGRGHSL